MEVTTDFLTTMTIRYLRENGMLNRFKFNIIKRNFFADNEEAYNKYNGNILMYLMGMTKRYNNIHYPLFVAIIWGKTIEGSTFWAKAHDGCDEYINYMLWKLHQNTHAQRRHQY